MVHQDGTGMHQVPLALPAGMGALDPEWSPDGAWLVFTAQTGNTSEIWAARPDGSGLQQIADVPGAQLSLPDWRP